MLRGCIPDSVSLRFEFSFVNGSSSSRYSIILVAYAAWLHSGFGFAPFRMVFMSGASFDHFGRICCVVAFQIRFRYVSNLVFMNGSSFELILGLFWSRMLRGAFQIRFRYVSNLVS